MQVLGSFFHSVYLPILKAHRCDSFHSVYLPVLKAHRCGSFHCVFSIQSLLCKLWSFSLAIPVLRVLLNNIQQHVDELFQRKAVIGEANARRLE